MFKSEWSMGIGMEFGSQCKAFVYNCMSTGGHSSCSHLVDKLASTSFSRGNGFPVSFFSETG